MNDQESLEEIFSATEERLTENINLTVKKSTLEQYHRVLAAATNRRKAIAHLRRAWEKELERLASYVEGAST